MTSEPITPKNDIHHSRNFWLLMVYQCCLQIGWIFKTESVIMPGFLDAIGGSAELRGCLPMLNRLGQSLPPLLASDAIRNTQRKARVLTWSTSTMAFAFLGLSAAWAVLGAEHQVFMRYLFLAVYGIFFAATGINMLVFNTLNGKLVRTTQRGQLSLLGTVIGVALASCCAFWLLHLWLSQDRATPDESRFDLVFAFTGFAFLLSAWLSTYLIERPDPVEKKNRNGHQLIKASIGALFADRNFMLLAIIAGLFGMGLTLFPHYQKLGRDRFELSFTALIPWVIAQNVGAASFSVPSGWIADRMGTRIVLRLMMLACCLVPVLAIVLARNPDLSWTWFTAVFWLLGMTPVTARFFNLYTLEITQRSNHPQYLSTLSIAMALPPVLLSIPMGTLIHFVSFEFAFGLGAACMVLGWLLTFFLIEPRHENGTTSKTV